MCWATYLHQYNNVPQFFEDYNVSSAKLDVSVVRNTNVKQICGLLQLHYLFLHIMDGFLSLENIT